MTIGDEVSSARASVGSRRDMLGLEGKGRVPTLALQSRSTPDYAKHLSELAPTEIKQQVFDVLGFPGAIIGSALFFVILRGSLLNPQNIAWLYAPVDSSAYYIAAAYFLKSGWTLPPGANPDYGLEIASSIFYADSIPLVALLLKP